MALVTPEEYMERLRKLKPKAYIYGEQVGSVAEHPLLMPVVNTLKLTYEMAQEPEYKDLITARSHLTGDYVNRFNHIIMEKEDLIRKCAMVRQSSWKTGCILRCTGGEALNSLYVTTYELDKQYNTKYHQRFLEFAKYFQENDLVGAQAMTDCKGDRSKRPLEQDHPDYFVRMVKKTKDGIIVRGAKNLISIAPVADEIFVMPSRAMRTPEEKDYAIAFAVPPDADGLVHIVNTTLKEPSQEQDYPFCSKHGSCESMLIFDDVFVPWERVFMCGEYEVQPKMLYAFATTHRHSRCACSSGITDIIAGAASIAAKYNGLDKVAHIRQKIAHLITQSESYYACGIAASALAEQTASGVWMPSILYSNVGKVLTIEGFHESLRILQDLAGGLTQTVPSSKDYENPQVKAYLDKYLKGRSDVSADYRLRLYRFLRDLTTRGACGFWTVVSATGAGGLAGAELMIRREVDLRHRENLVKVLADIPSDSI